MARDAFDLALKKLAAKACSRKKLQEALLRAGFGRAETVATLEKLEEMGYLNDEKLAEDIISGYMARKPCGRAYLAEKLRQSGISSAIIDSALDKISEEQEFTLARRLAARYLATNKAGVSRRSLALHLERRGFSPEIIESVIIYLD